jgi:hypothetical protein
MKLLNRIKDLPIWRLGTANGNRPGPHGRKAGTTGCLSPPPTLEEDDKSGENTSITSEQLAEFCEKYVPRPKNSTMSIISPFSERRAMIRTMYLDNILYHAAKLNEHNRLLFSRSEMYKESELESSLLFPIPSSSCLRPQIECTPEQWDEVQQDRKLYCKIYSVPPQALVHTPQTHK